MICCEMNRVGDICERLLYVTDPLNSLSPVPAPQAVWMFGSGLDLGAEQSEACYALNHEMTRRVRSGQISVT
jgi:hypothetical protein